VSEYESVIDEVAEAFRVAHEVHGGEAGAVLHAKTVASGAMAALLADHMAHETSVRMVVTPDVDDDTIAAIARDTELWEHKVRDVLGAVLVAQIRKGAEQQVRAEDAAALWGEGPFNPWLQLTPELQQFIDEELHRDVAECPFCDIIRGRGPADIVHQWHDAIAFVPLEPVTPGHVLVVPRHHTDEFTEDPESSAVAMRRAAELAVILDPDGEYNVITSAGPHATQTIDHLHLHLVPRRARDGLGLPWRPAPVEVTATKCLGCGMRLGHVNYQGHVLGWGCADAEDDDREYLAPQLGRALVDLIDRCVADEQDEPLYALLEAMATDHRVRPDAGPALVSIAESLAPLAPKMLRRTTEGTTSP
jgi:histidine triad (HIT) family protein